MTGKIPAQSVHGSKSLQPTALPPTRDVLRRLAEVQRDRLQRLLTEPVEYVGHERFESAHAARDLLNNAFHVTGSIRPWMNSAAAPAAAARADVGVTLSGREEQTLFLRMNYARLRLFTLLESHGGRRLTGRATAELLWWAAAADEARDDIVRANMPLVLAMAKRTRLGNVDYAELISEGNMALLRSVDKFDCGRGFKFSTYACRAILKSFSRVAMRTSRYRSQFPTEFDPLMERSNYQEEQRIEQEAQCVDDLREILVRNAAALSDVEVTVIKARFALGRPAGVEDAGPRTLEEVGLLIGVTKERVRQIQNRALAKLRTALQDEFVAA